MQAGSREYARLLLMVLLMGTIQADAVAAPEVTAEGSLGVGLLAEVEPGAEFELWPYETWACLGGIAFGIGPLSLSATSVFPRSSPIDVRLGATARSRGFRATGGLAAVQVAATQDGSRVLSGMFWEAAWATRLPIQSNGSAIAEWVRHLQLTVSQSLGGPMLVSELEDNIADAWLLQTRSRVAVGNTPLRFTFDYGGSWWTKGNARAFWLGWGVAWSIGARPHDYLKDAE